MSLAESHIYDDDDDDDDDDDEDDNDEEEEEDDDDDDDDGGGGGGGGKGNDAPCDMICFLITQHWIAIATVLKLPQSLPSFQHPKQNSRPVLQRREVSNRNLQMRKKFL